ncbi:phosphate/phosphite/phosphonate ABC transporter substrate-binding protein [Leptolyngbya sp. AN02str]|uniref:phosphate/phosphite/phosphonate ABC transporter substrate-binding protein n=1 Tax=Leptolyngbya sp. AN02str TaxID=3423363 RepID=UPI003D3144FB
MFLTRFTSLVSMGLLLGLVGCSGSAVDTNAQRPAKEETAIATEPATNPIVLGDISNNPTRSLDEFQPLADYLAAQLAESGIDGAKVKVAPDAATMSQWMANGEVDVFFDSAYPALRLAEEADAQLILRRWKEGDAEYHSIIFTMADSGVESLQDLPGHLVALDAPYSTSGYMLPVYHFLEENLKITEKNSLKSPVAADEVGYIFSYDDENVLEWVLNGDATVGVVDNQTFAELPESVRANMRILFETDPVPRHIALVASDLDPAVVNTITQRLLTLDQAEEGKAILEIFDETAKFDPFPSDDYLNQLQKMYIRVRAVSE